MGWQDDPEWKELVEKIDHLFRKVLVAPDKETALEAVANFVEWWKQ